MPRASRGGGKSDPGHVRNRTGMRRSRHSDRSMRLRGVDALLLGPLLPGWVGWLAFHGGRLVGGRPPVWPLPVHVERGSDPDAHPVVLWIHPAWEGGRVLRPGDVLLRADDRDLAGVTHLG